MNVQPIFKLQTAAATILAIATIAFAGCGGGSSGIGACKGYGGGGGTGTGGSGCVGNPVPSPAASAQPVGLNLAAAPTTDPTYGMVLGFFNGATGAMSEVVHLTASQNVQFTNSDASLAHTASFLGTWSGSFPPSFTNSLGATASPAGTSISSSSPTNFSAGNLNPGAVSAVYSSGGPAILVFGCFYHYKLNGMRTVIIVM